MRILVVEDEPVLASSIAKGLRRQSFAVDVAGDGAAAIDAIDATEYDVVLLDRDLPHVHGDDVCRHIVANRPGTRTLMLTAAGDVLDRVQGLSLGADDYLPKPFVFAELLARTHALMRRSNPARPPVLEFADIRLDPQRVDVFRGDNYILLTKKEFGVLHELMREPGTVVSSEQLLDSVWDANTDPFTNVVRVTVMTLRRKLGDPAVIDTVTGVGYRLGGQATEVGSPPSGSSARVAKDSA